MKLLCRTVDVRLERVMLRRYGKYCAYSEAIAVFSDKFIIKIDLREESFAPKAETFVVQVREAELPEKFAEWDCFELSDFIVANIFVLRRAEWIERLEAPILHQTVGRVINEQKFGSIDDAVGKSNVAVVDSGVCFISRDGAELYFDADTFPLVFQFRYIVASSPLPQAAKIKITQSR
jgi:hypothetical protein